MDVVVFSQRGSSIQEIGAMQENGRLVPLSVWTTEPVFGDAYLELLVAESDLLPGYQAKDVVIHSLVPESALTYGSRQVGGGTFRPSC